jgi:membrane protein
LRRIAGDGTLIDSNELHVAAWHRVFAEAGHAVTSEAIRGEIGKGGDHLVPALLPGLPQREQHKLTQAHGHLFKSEFLAKAKPFPGARELIERVHADGSKVVLASSASGDELTHYVDLMGIGDLVAASTSSDDVDASKPAPDIFASALRKAGVDAHAAVAVGDTPYDVQSARASGIATVTVLSGGFPADDLKEAGAAAIYTDVGQIGQAFAGSMLSRRSG